VKISGPWKMDRIEDYLEQSSFPLRLSVNGSEGWPVVASLWFAFDEGSLWCATQKGSRIAALIERDPRCAFEISPNEPPYQGVRGQGRASLHDELGPVMLDRLIGRYVDASDGRFARWLRSRSDDEAAIRIQPVHLMSWDYERRMSG